MTELQTHLERASDLLCEMCGMMSSHKGLTEGDIEAIAAMGGVLARGDTPDASRDIDSRELMQFMFRLSINAGWMATVLERGVKNAIERN